MLDQRTDLALVHQWPRYDVMHEEHDMLLRDKAVARIEEIRQRHLIGKTVLSSRDPDVAAAMSSLEDAFPSEFAGVKRWFLPISPVIPRGPGCYAAYFSRLDPRQVVTRRIDHQMYELNTVISGSLTYNGVTLTVGDWLWAPAGEQFMYAAGTFGCVLFTQWPYTEHVDIVRLGGQLGKRSTSSRDPQIEEQARAMRNRLGHLVEGDHQFIPFAPTMPGSAAREGRFFQWVSRIDPNTMIPGHKHPLEKLGDMKIVISGSLSFQDRELSAGDWFWVPSSTAYTFSSGDRGAVLMSGWPYN